MKNLTLQTDKQNHRHLIKIGCNNQCKLCLRISPYRRILQYRKCQEYGYIAQICQNSIVCAGNHNPTDCKENSFTSCINCSRNKKPNHTADGPDPPAQFFLCTAMSSTPPLLTACSFLRLSSYFMRLFSSQHLLPSQTFVTGRSFSLLCVLCPLYLCFQTQPSSRNYSLFSPNLETSFSQLQWPLHLFFLNYGFS